MFRTLAFLNDAVSYAQTWLPIIRDYAVALGVIAAALGVAYVVPNLRVKLSALLVATSVVATTIAYGVGVNKGAERVRAERKQDLKSEEREGEQARVESERVVRVEPPVSRVLRDDPWNRDTFVPAERRAKGP